MFKHRIRSTLYALVLAASLVAGPGIIAESKAANGTAIGDILEDPSAEASTHRILGGLDLTGYCQHLGYQGARLLSNDADAWRCYTTFSFYDLEILEACEWQYDDPGAWARTENGRDPFSWTCGT